MEHAYTTGERRIGSYSVDGYAEYTEADGSTRKSKLSKNVKILFNIIEIK